MRTVPVRASVALVALMLAACTGGTPGASTGASAGTSAAPSASTGTQPTESAATEPTESAATEPTEPTESTPAEPSGEPIVVGSTLSLTGAFAATGVIHQLAGQLFVDRLNQNGGLLGRPVEWTVLDDESDPAKVTQLYERLITQDEVDLVIGPYATPNIIAAVAVAERYGYTIPQHTAVLAPLLQYDCQFPAWSISPTPQDYVPNQLFDALESLPEPPETVAIVSNQSGATDFVAYGQADVEDGGFVAIAPERGLEVVAEIRYPPTTTDWAPIATQIRDANPDVVINSGIGVDPVNLLTAMQQLDYDPPMMFSLFPAPGPLLGLGDASDGMLSVSLFESVGADYGDYGEGAEEIVEAFEEGAAAAGLPYTAFETQATASWNAWEILVQGVEAAGGTDDQQAICDALHENGASTTFSGDLTFDPEVSNFWPSTVGIKQIQDGNWVMVWPEDRATSPLQGPGD